MKAEISVKESFKDSAKRSALSAGYRQNEVEYLLRAQEPKAPVTDCDHALFGVHRPLDNLHFQLLLQNRLMDFDETLYG